ncbi:CDP-diacylglycerol--glycerol-3-phosphate 3-phosphatidyltransferase [Lecanora helva]
MVRSGGIDILVFYRHETQTAENMVDLTIDSTSSCRRNILDDTFYSDRALDSSPLPLSSLSALTADLDLLAPRIDINPDQIEIIETPEDFYNALLSRIRSAKRRIYLSTLYVGKTEHEFVSAVRHALEHNGPDLRVSILTDALRGTREAPEASCASLLIPLVKEFPNQIEVSMYHTPNFTGIRKAIIPKRINEGWGLQHIKLYGIDDEVILSGANLSNDYFTNRQDRYHIFSSRRVTDYFATIHEAVSKISFQLLPSKEDSGFSLQWPSSNRAPNPLDAPKEFVSAATSLLRPLAKPENVPPRTASTSVYPLICHPPTINTELPVFTTLMKPPIESYTFTAGYFNPHPMITACLLAAPSPPKQVPGTILTASPYANGFFGSRGISGMLPAAYSHLSLSFLKAARKKNISLREWRRGTVGQEDGWTYHAKGLWVTLPEQKNSDARAGPCATIIGSSNYTTRSYGLDLEVGAAVVTSDEGLRRKYKREQEMLLRPSRQVEEGELEGSERRASWRVRLAMWIVKVVGGSL